MTAASKSLRVKIVDRVTTTSSGGFWRARIKLNVGGAAHRHNGGA